MRTAGRLPLASLSSGAKIGIYVALLVVGLGALLAAGMVFAPAGDGGAFNAAVAVLAVLYAGLVSWYFFQIFGTAAGGHGASGAGAGDNIFAKAYADAQERVRAAREKTKASIPFTILPWIIALSESGDASGFLRRASRHSAVGNPRDQMPSDAAGGRWFLSPDFAALEVGFGRTTGPAREDVWNDALSFLSARRSARPLDGVYALISFETLQGPTARLAAWGGELARLSDLATSWLGADLPVTLLVTRSDRAPGMSAFVSHLGNAASAQAIGWFPAAGERQGAVSEAALDRALGKLEDRLRATGLALVGRESDITRKAAIWDCTEALAGLRPALATLLKSIFAGRSAARLGGLFLVGAPLPGDTSEAGLFVDDLARRFMPRSVDLAVPLARKSA